MKPEVFVMFSGGLDSTVVAMKLMPDYRVTLGHVIWNNVFNCGHAQYERARIIAMKLGLPLTLVGRVDAPGIEWAPVLATLSIQHCKYKGIGILASGVVGQTPDADIEDHGLHWLDVQAGIAKVLQWPGTILRIMEGVPRKESWQVVPEYIRPILWTCHNRGGDAPRCGLCAKCRADKAIGFYYSQQERI